MDAKSTSVLAFDVELSDDAIIAAMQSVPDYLEITTGDFRTIYNVAYRHALRHASATAAASPLRNLEPPRPPLVEIMRSWIGAFIGIVAVAGANRLLFPHSASAMMIGSFGATAVLLFGAMRSPLAQPRNVIGGHVISAIVGVTCALILGGPTVARGGGGGGERYSADASDADIASAGRGDRLDCRNRIRGDPQAWLHLRPGAGGSRRPRNVGCRPDPEQSRRRTALSRSFAVNTAFRQICS